MQWMKNLKVGKKIGILILTSVLFITAAAFTGFYFIGKSNDLSTMMFEDRLLPVKGLNATRTHTRAIESDLKGLIIGGDATLMTEFRQDIEQRNEKINQELSAYENSNLLPYEKDRLPRLLELVKEMKSGNSQVVALIDEGKLEEALSYYRTDVIAVTNELNTILTELADFNAENAEQLNEEIAQDKATADKIMIAMLVVAVALAVTLGTLISRMITQPLKLVGEKMQLAGSGDMTVTADYEAKDEIGIMVTTFNDMIANMKETIHQVYDNANSLAASSEQISASTEEIAKGASQQANDASSSSEMVKEMTYAVQAVSKNAEEAAQFSEATLEAANKGGDVIRATIEGMDAISTKINELSSKSVQIGEIVEVIDDIAEQTNLLALNAAIEAARAGEAGKGFAVVADEVRKLAERSSKATKEISDLVGSIQANTDDSVNAVVKGNEQAKEAGIAFENIVKLVRDSATKVSEIAAASEEQAAQSSEVQLAVENIAAVSEETAASVEETAATANDLALMAEALNTLASKFKL